MEEELELFIKEIEVYIRTFNDDENKAYLALPEFVQRLNAIFVPIIGLLGENENDNCVLGQIQDAMYNMSFGIEKRDTIFLIDVLEYQIKPITNTILEAIRDE